MTEPLGLSVGTTNLVALRAGRGPVTCPTPAPQSDPVAHAAAVATALDGIAAAVDYGSPVTVTVPAYWDPMMIDRLRSALAAQPRLAGRFGPTLVTDAAATLTALSGEPRLPRDGVVAVCDLGGAGTDITLINAGAGHAPISATVHFDGFAGAGIDRAIAEALAPGDRSAELVEQCRLAKEALGETGRSAVDLAGAGAGLTLTRAELDRIVAEPLAGLLTAVSATLVRDAIPAERVTGVVLSGGGAGLPMLADEITARLDVPVLVAAQPGCAAAAGALLMSGGKLPELNVSSPAVVATPAVVPHVAPILPTAPSARSSAPPPRPRPTVPADRPWFRRPMVWLGVAALVAAVLAVWLLTRPVPQVTNNGSGPVIIATDTALTCVETAAGAGFC